LPGNTFSKLAHTEECIITDSTTDSTFDFPIWRNILSVKLAGRDPQAANIVRSHPRLGSAAVFTPGFLYNAERLLRPVFGDRLVRVIVFGSEVRGQANPESDIDLLVLLTGPVSLGRDLETIIRALYPIQLVIERPIHVLPADIRDFEAGEYAIYRQAKLERIGA